MRPTYLVLALLCADTQDKYYVEITGPKNRNWAHSRCICKLVSSLTEPMMKPTIKRLELENKN